MQKAKKSVSITMILAIISLACLLLCSFNISNAWFTTSGNIEIDVTVAGLNAYVYQTTEKDGAGTETIINAKSNEPTYINLSEVIHPGKEIPLYLKLKNNEAGGFYLRFKFVVLALNKDTDIEIETTETVASEFVKNGDYYYYMNGENNQIAFSTGNIMLINGCQISGEEFENKNLYGQTLKIVLSVEFSDTEFTLS